MWIVVPFTTLHPDTARLLEEFAPDAERVSIDPARTNGYCDLMCAWWERGETFTVVEQDIGLHADVLPQLESCPGLWCGFRYRIGLGASAQTIAALGCTRFRAEVLTAEPDLMARVATDGTGGLPAGDWRRLDVRLMDELHRRGYQRCEHTPEVAHFHTYA